MRSLTVDLQVALPVALLAASLAASCSSTKPSLPEGWGTVGTTRGYHDGPKVVFGPSGTARYAAPLLEAYDERSAMASVTFAYKALKISTTKCLSLLNRFHARFSRIDYQDNRMNRLPTLSPDSFSRYATFFEMKKSFLERTCRRLILVLDFLHPPR